MHRIGNDERRRRLATRHHLRRDAESVESIASALIGLHSSDPSSVYLTARARLPHFTHFDLEAALYDRKTLVRITAMRKTLFVMPCDLAVSANAATAHAFGTSDHRRLESMLTDQGIATDAAAWIEHVASRVLDELATRGEATAKELRDAIPELRQSLRFGEGKSWGGTTGVSTRILFLLAADGAIVRGRPLGSWTSSQYRWAPTASWLGDELPSIDPALARAELARAWLSRFGPGTLTDLKWWTGWSVRDTRPALSAAGAVEVELEGGTGWALVDDLDPEPPGEDWAALLPSLDSTVMGWKERSWYLGGLAPQLFDRNGNAGPTVWWNGRIVGGWAQRRSGAIAVRLLEDLPREAVQAIEIEADALERWLDDTRITPRFRAPLDKALVDA